MNAVYVQHEKRSNVIYYQIINVNMASLIYLLYTQSRINTIKELNLNTLRYKNKLTIRFIYKYKAWKGIYTIAVIKNVCYLTCT